MADAGRGVILPFPVQRAQHASIELVTRLAPSRSLVDSLMADAGLANMGCGSGHGSGAYASGKGHGGGLRTGHSDH